MDLKSEFAVDEQKESEGVWETWDDAKFLIAALNNPEYNKAIKRLPRDTRRKMERGQLSDSESRKIIARLVSKTILLDWDNLEDDGEPLVYSRETAEAMLLKYKHFSDWVWETAADQERYRLERMEDDAGN